MARGKSNCKEKRETGVVALVCYNHFMKKIRQGSKLQSGYKIKIAGETIITGPGTVPTSAGSVAQTSIKEMVSLLRKASREGTFEPEDSDKYGSLQSSTK